MYMSYQGKLMLIAGSSWKKILCPYFSSHVVCIGQQNNILKTFAMIRDALKS